MKISNLRGCSRPKQFLKIYTCTVDSTIIFGTVSRILEKPVENPKQFWFCCQPVRFLNRAEIKDILTNLLVKMLVHTCVRNRYRFSNLCDYLLI